ncbi:protein kinase domain-containing protein [Massilia sp. DWR3-1-1]|uniref:protein kinase domain-containing protein n=1 Tax=Massilia sp. DWR3-1-1 TaxID=2804559 RepID=UPI003CEBF044
MLEAGMVVTLDRHSYRLDAPLAGSAYGLVWRADTLPVGRQVALKFVNRAQMDQAAPSQRQRWTDGATDEAAFLRQLAPWDARHLVRLLDSGSHAGLPALALELLEGDVGAWVARRRAAGQAADVAQAFDWIGQVNQALAKVHQYGRRHLDLKPSNLLLSDGGAIVKLADFGTSRALADHAPHVYAGTPNWQAPEQLFGTGPAATHADPAIYVTSAATDYFALGALLYYLVSGGAMLAFCRLAAQAHRDGQGGDALPPTLGADEADRFAQCCEQGLGTRASGEAALALLRALLARDPAARPRHALAIGRMLAAVRAADAVSWSLA